MNFFKFVLAMFLSFLPGIVGVFVTPISSGQNAWYNSLTVSSLTPDGWVFSFVWTVLYFLIGLALFFVMLKQNTNNRYDKTNAYILFVINIIFNALWSYAFFGAELPEVALIILAALIVTAIFMARAFFRISKASFWLTVPYIVWLMFAFYLNGMIIYLN